jgi:hydrogenase maturation protein HypF
MALAHLTAAGVSWPRDLPCAQAVLPEEKKILDRQLTTGFNCVPTSSMGRLFDAAASLLGIRHIVTYEAQGAMELEAMADPQCCDGYRFDLVNSDLLRNDEIIFDPASLWREMIADWQRGTALSTIAARFHRAVANLIVEASRTAREKSGVATVALSGGVFQNVLLLQWARNALEESGFQVLTHSLVPPNDGGLALGQAAIGRQSA